MIKTVIIEDEKNSQELLEQMLTNHCDNVEIIGFADSVVSGIEAIQRLKPELVLLDIEIKGGTSFEILSAIENPTFKVIFITGYDHYAIKAIKYSALDYLLKPVNLLDLQKAIKKVNSTLHLSSSQMELLQTDPNDSFNKIVLTGNNSYRVVQIDNIFYLEGNRAYTVFYLNNGNTHIGSYPISYYEELLNSKMFFRIHKSYVINTTKVSTVDSGRGGNVNLINGTTLPIAVRRKSSFIKSLTG